MRIFLLFLILAISPLIKAQDFSAVSKPELVYLFHTVHKSPILQEEMGSYFVFDGEYTSYESELDSMESNALKDIHLIRFYKQDISRVSRGLLIELFNKTAVWDFNSMMEHVGNKMQDSASYKTKYKFFVNKLEQSLPQSLRGKEALSLKMKAFVNPNLNINDKVKLLDSYSELSYGDKAQCIEAFQIAYQEYIAARIKAYNAFFSIDDSFVSANISAGDGDIAQEEFVNREKDEINIFNKALPFSSGYFPYESFTDNSTSVPKLRVQKFPVIDLHTYGSNYQTRLHVDIYEYTAEKQITVVYKKQDLNYPLFSNGSTRFLAPDSIFKKSGTFQGIINALKKDIATLNEMIYGKKGFDYWIAHYQKESAKLEMAISTNEMSIASIRTKPIETKAVGKKNKDGSYSVETNSNQKTRVPRQDLFIFQNQELQRINTKIKQLKIQKEESVELMASYQTRLIEYTNLLGLKWAKYQVKNDVYTFEDGTVFDYNRQDLIFAKTAISEDVSLKILSIPHNSRETSSSELKLHYSMYPTVESYMDKVQHKLADVFEIDNWVLEGPIFGKNDSLSYAHLAELLIGSNKKLKATISGLGVGFYDGAQVIASSDQELLSDYEGETVEAKSESINNPGNKQLRQASVSVDWTCDIHLKVQASTDAIDKGTMQASPVVLAKAKKAGLNNNQLLTAYQSAALSANFMQGLLQFVQTNYGSQDVLKVNKKLLALQKSALVKVGKASFKLSELI